MAELHLPIPLGFEMPRPIPPPEHLRTQKRFQEEERSGWITERKRQEREIEQEQDERFESRRIQYGESESRWANKETTNKEFQDEILGLINEAETEDESRWFNTKLQDRRTDFFKKDTTKAWNEAVVSFYREEMDSEQLYNKLRELGNAAAIDGREDYAAALYFDAEQVFIQAKNHEKVGDGYDGDSDIDWVLTQDFDVGI